MNKPTQVKPYTITMEGENDVTINMYGEVVESHPVDWWTGKLIPGNFIALDDFLRDLDDLGTKDNITVHINSVGGSLYAGLAIYNRLRGLPAKVTTINDALAASAASIIFQAGDTRKMNPGSNLMIHEAAVFLFGSYQTADLRSIIKQMDAHNKSGVAAYADRTGRDADAIKNMLAKETWMTGQEAVDAGFADEVIDGGLEVSMSLSPDKKYIVSNGVAMSTRGMSAFPAAAAVMTEEQAAKMFGGAQSKPSASPATEPVNANHKNAGGSNMEPITNMEDLRKAYPDLASQIENAAKDSAHAEGVQAERARIQGIEAIENAIGDKELVKNAKYGEKPMTAQELAFAAMQKQAAIGATVVKNLEDDAANSGAADVSANPTGGDHKAEEQEEEANAINMIASAFPKNKKEG